MITKFILCAAAATLTFGCSQTAEQAKPAAEKAATAAPAATNYPGEPTSAETITAASDLKYLDIMIGSGTTAEAGKKVVVHYTGYLTNGLKVDSSVDRDAALEFLLGSGEMIKGWDVGIVGMKVGGKRKLIIPPALGYGASDYGPIPGNSVMVFDIELIEVK